MSQDFGNNKSIWLLEGNDLSICPATITVCSIDIHWIIAEYDIVIIHLVLRNLETEKDGHGLIIK